MAVLPAAGSDNISVAIRVEGSSQNLFDGEVNVESSGAPASALDALEQALNEENIAYEIIEGGYGKYINSIDGEEAGQFGGFDGWLFLVNGAMAEVGAADYEVQDGDELVFYYGMYPPDTLIPEVSISQEEPQSGEEITVTVSSSYYDWNSSQTVEVLVEGATVSCDGVEYTTNAQGEAVITGLEAGSYTLRVSKDVPGSYPRLLRTAGIPLTVSLPAGKTVAVRVEGSSQNLFDGEVNVVSSGAPASALDALEQALNEGNIAYEITESEYGKYINSIAGEEAGQFGGFDGWLFLVNGAMAEVGAADYEVQDGDELVFYYGMYPPDTLIPEVSISPKEPRSGEEITVTVSSSYYDWNTAQTVEVLVEGATVSCDGVEYTTNAQGEAVMTGLEAGSYTLRVSKDVPGSYPRLLRTAGIPLTVTASASDTPTVSSSIAKAVAYLIDQQEDSGKLGPKSALALYKAGNDLTTITRNGKTDLDYLQQQLLADYDANINTTAQLAQTIMEIKAGGGDPADFAGHNLVADLIALQDANGHFGDSGEEDYVHTHYWAITALDEAGVEIPNALAARQWLLNSASSNGGFSWVVGGPTSPDMTTFAIRALLILGQPKDSEPVTKALSYLATQRNDDGSFTDGMSATANIWSTAEVVKALVDLDINPCAGDWGDSENNPILYLISQQEDSGKIGNLAGTADSLIALLMFDKKFDLGGAGDSPTGPGSGGSGGSPGSSDTIKVKIAVVGAEGELLFAPQAVTIEKDGPFGFSAMAALDATGLSWSFSPDAEGFVIEIDGQRNSGQNGWCYSVNGISPSCTAKDHKVSEGDRIIWWYSTDARFEGPSWDELTKSETLNKLPEENAPDEEMKTALQQYTAQIDANIPLRMLNAENKMTPAEAEDLQGLLAANQVDLKALAGEEAMHIGDQEIVLMVPEQALSQPVEISIKELPSGEQPSQYAVRLGSSVYEFGPSGTVFAHPVTIGIKVALTAVIDIDALVPAWFDEETGQWVPLPAVIDLETGLVVFQIDHFTAFAVVQKPPRRGFDDIQDYAWAKDAIEILAGQNIISGTGLGFEPGRDITRAEFVRLVVTAAGLQPDENGPRCMFTDVSAVDWFEPAVRCACQNKLLSGYADGTFRPGKSISRYEAAVILLNLGGENSLSNEAALLYADSELVPDWAREAVAYMHHTGLMTGYPDGSFGGSRSLSRAETAVIIYRYLCSNLS